MAFVPASQARIQVSGIENPMIWIQSDDHTGIMPLEGYKNISPRQTASISSPPFASYFRRLYIDISEPGDLTLLPTFAGVDHLVINAACGIRWVIFPVAIQALLLLPAFSELRVYHLHMPAMFLDSEVASVPELQDLSPSQVLSDFPDHPRCIHRAGSIILRFRGMDRYLPILINSTIDLCLLSLLLCHLGLEHEFRIFTRGGRTASQAKSSRSSPGSRARCRNSSGQHIRRLPSEGPGGIGIAYQRAPLDLGPLCTFRCRLNLQFPSPLLSRIDFSPMPTGFVSEFDSEFLSEVFHDKVYAGFVHYACRLMLLFAMYEPLFAFEGHLGLALDGILDI
ncbi:hypothetical protein K438DRAFT_2082236 [Mycena galopus ATCC 62051]|nr:hypothetical protein K438DRAFT_2082236 [Mycena galopus ATCC 62051]